MWPFIRNARVSPSLQLSSNPALRAPPLTRAASASTAGLLNAKTQTAKDLAATGIWDPKAKRTRVRKATSAPAAAKKATPAKKGKSKKSDATDSEPAKPAATGDKLRVNITSEKLCDDIAKYIGPTLERHVGCDILDINPGAGLWSSKLHEVLKPRSHILMEPDEELYKPFLDDLLQKPGARLVPKSGILWKELTDAMGYLEHQKPPEKGTDAAQHPRRNDTLLVTANLCSYPKRKYRMFDSVAILVLYQLLTSVRYGALFQKYGLVRMLLWINDDDKRTFLPRSVQNRKKSALQAEFACEYFAEVAGKDPASLQYVAEQLKKLYHRNEWINVASTRDALERMREAGIQMPSEKRMMEATKEVVKMEKEEGKSQKIEGEEDASSVSETATAHTQVNRPYQAELEALNEAYDAGELSDDTAALRRRAKLRSQVKLQENQAVKYDQLIREMDELTRQRAEIEASRAAFGITDESESTVITTEPTSDSEATASPPPMQTKSSSPSKKPTKKQVKDLESRLADLEAREEAFKTKVSALTKNTAIDFRIHRDNAHLYRQSPPVLLYDRRPWEPLRVQPDEFFPNVECALLDVQPKAMHHLLREVGSKTSAAARATASSSSNTSHTTPGSGSGTPRTNTNSVGGAGDMFDLIQRSMLFTSLEPVGSALEKLWPGAREGVLPHCPSLRDPAKGGRPGDGHLSICPRVMNETQWTEVLEGFVKWPFRPTYAELVGRLGDDIEVQDSSTEGAMGSGSDI